jgi:hypothetical protein
MVAMLTAAVFLGTAVAEEITSDNWTEMVGFEPDTEALKIKKGTKISKDNVAEYAKWLPPSMKMWIEKYSLKLKVRDYEPIHPSEGYIEATNKYRGQPRIIEIGKEYRKRGR